jgi:hypothetical protein
LTRCEQTQLKPGGVTVVPNKNQTKNKTTKNKDRVKLRTEILAAGKKEMKAIVKQSLRAGGGVLGGMAGEFAGMGDIGRKAGSELGRKLSRLIGTGDYSTNDVSVNSLFPGARAAPSMGSFADKGGIRVKHREFIQDLHIKTPGTFQNLSFGVNPGSSSIFPYLSQIAANYEQYRFHGLVFEFVSSTAPYGATSLGTVMMAMEYDAASPAFTSKPVLENSDYAVSARVDKSIMYGVECAPGSQATNYLYVRGYNPTTTVNFLDVGLMNVACVPGASLPADSPLGELWVTYDVELIRPRISPSRYGWSHLTGRTLPGQRIGSDTQTNLIKAVGSCSGISSEIINGRIVFDKVEDGDVFDLRFLLNGTNEIHTDSIDVEGFVTMPSVYTLTGVSGGVSIGNSGASMIRCTRLKAVGGLQTTHAVTYNVTNNAAAVWDLAIVCYGADLQNDVFTLP